MRGLPETNEVQPHAQIPRTPEGKLKIVRIDLPEFVSDLLKTFYKMPNVTKGIFDLVIWNESEETVRFVEAKCPHWDRLTPEQKAFTDIAQQQNIEVEVFESEFEAQDTLRS